MTDQAGRKFASADEAFEYIIAAGECPEAWAVAEAWGWDWDADIKPSLPELKRRDLGDSPPSPSASPVVKPGSKLAQRLAEAEDEDPETEPTELEPAAVAVVVPAEARSEPESDGELGPRDAKIVLPGLCGDIQQHYLRTAMQPSSAFSLIPALTMVGFLASPNVAGPSGPRGTALQELGLGLGPSGVGKAEIIVLLKDMMGELGLLKQLGPNRYKSGPAIVKFVKRVPVSLAIQDEISSLLAKLVDERKASATEVEILDRLREFYALKPGEAYTSSEGAQPGDDTVLIENPHHTWLGFGVDEEFFGVCRNRELRNGTLNRLTLYLQPTLIKNRDDYEVLPLGNKLVEGLEKVRGLKPHMLDWTAGAKEVYKNQLDWVYEQKDPREQTLWIRSPEKLVKTASKLTVGKFSRRVEQAEMDTAKRIMSESDSVFTRGIHKAEETITHDHAELKLEIARRMRVGLGDKNAPGEASPAEIKTSFRNNTKHKNAIADALADMVASGTISGLEHRDTGGRKKNVHRLLD